jgi:UDPglucose 6-dehydrogenase
VGADINQVRVGIASDGRIGPQFLFPGIGYGGSCFPKDVRALIQTAKDHDCPATLLEQVDHINLRQRDIYLEKLNTYFNGDLSGKTFAVWGLSFKPRTDDMREAPSKAVIEALLEQGALIRAFDPKAQQTARRLFGDRVYYAQTAYDAADGADAVLLVTEWNEFRRPDFDRLKGLLKNPVIFDGRNQYDAARMAQRGFYYVPMGKTPVEPVMDPLAKNPSSLEGEPV